MRDVPRCDRELGRAARASLGRLEAADREHLESCAACRWALELDARLPAALAAPEDARRPAAGEVLLRARLRVRHEAARRSLAPVEVWRSIALAAALAGLAAAAALGGWLDVGRWSAWSAGEQLLALGATAATLLALRARPGRLGAG